MPVMTAARRRSVRSLNKAECGNMNLTSILVYTGLATFHALGLFSVGLIMGEGRLQCLLLAVATLLLLKSALRAVLGARSLASAAAAATIWDAQNLQGKYTASNAVDGIATGAVGTVAEAISVSKKSTTVQHRDSEAQSVPKPGQPSTDTADWSRPYVVVMVVAAAVVMLACNAALQPLGLIDRSGQDPHDKTQPSAELLVGADARLQQVLLLCFTIGPSIAIWIGVSLFSRWLRQPKLWLLRDAQKPTTMSTYDDVLLFFVRCCCAVAYVSLTAFWVAQLTGHSDMTMMSSIKLISMFDQEKVFLLSSSQRWMSRLWVRFMRFRQTLQDSALLPYTSDAFISFVVQLPFRLLFPRAVYVSALAAFVAVIVSIGLRATVRHSGMLLQSQVMQNQPAGYQQQLALSYCCELLVWLSAVFSAALVMVLGYKGPAMMMLAVIQGICCCLLLRVHAAANRYAQQGNALLRNAGQASICDSTSGDLNSIVGSGAWAMMTLQLFFCSGHFCEFSGLQYASAFIGFDDMIWYWSGSLLLLNTCGFLFLGCLTMPLMMLTGSSRLQSRQKHTQEKSTAQRLRLQLTCGVLVINSTRLAALAVSMISAAVQQQHILLWAIFAPKLVFEMWFMAVTDIGQLFTVMLIDHVML